MERTAELMEKKNPKHKMTQSQATFHYMSDEPINLHHDLKYLMNSAKISIIDNQLRNLLKLPDNPLQLYSVRVDRNFLSTAYLQ
jgi:hypothetical protein